MWTSDLKHMALHVAFFFIASQRVCLPHVMSSSGSSSDNDCAMDSLVILVAEEALPGFHTYIAGRQPLKTGNPLKPCELFVQVSRYSVINTSTMTLSTVIKSLKGVSVFRVTSLITSIIKSMEDCVSSERRCTEQAWNNNSRKNGSFTENSR